MQPYPWVRATDLTDRLCQPTRWPVGRLPPVPRCASPDEHLLGRDGTGDVFAVALADALMPTGRSIAVSAPGS